MREVETSARNPLFLGGRRCFIHLISPPHPPTDIWWKFFTKSRYPVAGRKVSFGFVRKAGLGPGEREFTTAQTSVLSDKLPWRKFRSGPKVTQLGDFDGLLGNY
jgi:hypothetical protein